MEELIKECLKYQSNGRPMFKALMLHSNGKWTGDYRTWSKEKDRRSNWGETPHEVLTKMLEIFKKDFSDNLL